MGEIFNFPMLFTRLPYANEGSFFKQDSSKGLQFTDRNSGVSKDWED